jgi:multidrug efflux pump subunit AcrA (membrane-fusion protein)
MHCDYRHPCQRTPFSAIARRGAAFLAIVVVLALIGTALFAAAYYVVSRAREGPKDILTHTVKRGLFVHDVVERGEVESSRNVEIRCEVKSNNTTGTAILDVLEEGTRVQPGDVLVRLDSSALEQQRVQQQILCNTSEALLITARNEYEAAKIAKKEYEEGVFRQEEQVIQSSLFVAEETLRRAQQYALYSERLAAKGYVTALQLEGDKFAVDKARNEVDTARTKLRVLQEYTKEKMLMTLESAIRTANAKLKAQQESHQLEMDKLKDIEEQIAKCVIRAPQAGTVVYANKENRRNDTEFVVEPGALVLERQAIIRLPDPTYMQVKAMVSESRVTLLKPSMKVTVRLDAFDDEVLRGEVVKVNEYPEPGGWFSSQVKEYATFVKIFDPPPQIRPGLTAEVRVHVAQHADALQVPVEAIHEHGEKLYCMRRDGDKWEAREVEIGASNDKFVMIGSGLGEMDQVAMDPRSLLDVVHLPKLQTKPPVTLAADQTDGRGQEADAREQGGPAGSDSPSAAGGQLGDRTALAEADGPRLPSAVADDLLARLDSNRDGRLGGKEVPADEAARWDEADTNGDGWIDRTELTAAITRKMQPAASVEGGLTGGALP